ncbi:tumor necrosis factor receptor superfamily member 26-like [Lethenteron reissneri]|uniref:tumor necrosis factor receptor superfamily member 26-like n=1 Tax=Lethenteron reissneri TaxID=7753 RepID=UPI002AB7B5F2|nr:tumor necrosis factor receptor superfamily member 26-like [Lethenteron reissneri]
MIPPWMSILVRGVILLVVGYALQELSATTECGHGFYKSPQGKCCELCRAGMYKAMDCIADGMSALCEQCPRGRFMDRDSQEEECTQCSICGPGEEVAVNCSVAQDTVCRCMEGLQRDGNSGICLPEESHPGSSRITKTLK